MKLAPYARKHLDDNQQDAIICLVGSEAWDYYGNGKGTEWELIKSSLTQYGEILPADYMPVVVGRDQLNEINELKLADKNHCNFRFYQCGKFSDEQKTALELNLAKNTEAKTNVIPFHSGDSLYTPREYENLNENLRLENLANDEIINMIAASVKPDITDNYPEYFRKLKASQQVEAFIKSLGGRTALNETGFYQFNGRCWDYLADEGERDRGMELIVSFLNEHNIHFNPSTPDSMRKLLPYFMEKMGEPNRDLLAFNNGELNVKTGELLPHKAGSYLVGEIGEDYPTEPQPTPNFDAFIDWVSYGDQQKKDVLLATLYMILTTQSSWQLFVEVTGDGGAGKTVFYRIAQMLVGAQNWAVLSLDDAEDKRARKVVVGKKLVCSEDQKLVRQDGGMLRTMTGGGDIYIEPKYKHGYSYTPDFIYLMTNNTPIHFTERKGGTHRRRVLLAFNREIPVKDRVENFELKIKEELAGIIYLILNRFIGNPKEAEALLKEHINSEEAQQIKESADPFFAFSKAFEVVDEITPDCLKWQARGVKEQTRAAAALSLYGAYEYFLVCNNDLKSEMKVSVFKELLPAAIKQRGEQFRATRINGTVYTNLKFKDRNATLDDWEN